MNFEQFVDEVKNSIKDYLPEEFQDAQIELHKHEKLNESYLGMTIRKENQTVAPTINLNKFYNQYSDFEKEELPFVFEEMSDIIQQEPIKVDLKPLMNYEAAKDKLFIRVSDADRNSEYLENIPHRRVENLAITYHIMASASDGEIGSAPITNQMLKTYGITEEQLHQDALENSPKLFPAKVESISTIMEKMMREDMRQSGMSDEQIDVMIEEMGISNPNPLTVVTNDQQMNGAAVIFYPGQMEEIGKSVKGDFFILPSSTHEVLILPDDGGMTYQDLKAMVMEVNSTQVMPEERLADEVYHYDAKDRVFERAGAFEDRQKIKAQELGGNKDVNLGQPGHKPKHKSHDMSL